MEQLKKDALVTGMQADSPMTGFGSSTLGETEVTISDIWLAIVKRKLLIVLFTVATVALVGLYTFLKRPVYESVAQIEFDPDQSGSLGLEEMISQKFSASDTDARVQTQVQILQSDTVSMQVVKKLQMAQNPAFAHEIGYKGQEQDPQQMSPRDRESLLRVFHNDEKVTVLPKTRVIEVRYRSTDPKLATDAVNAIVDCYLERNFQVRYQGTAQVSEWLSKQMDEFKTHAMEAQRQLAEFQKQHDILGTDENENIVTERLRLLNGQLTDAESDRILKEAKYRLAQTGNPELIANVVPSTTLQMLRTQEAQLKQDLAVTESKYGKGYPKLREQREQMANLDSAIKAEVNSVGQRLRDEYLASSRTESMLKAAFEAQKQEAFKLNESAAQFAILRHEVESGQALSDTLELKLKEAGVTAGLASADISVIDRGKLPAKPVAPKPALNLALGLIGGLFGGLILAFVLESMDDTLRTSDDVEKTSGLPALAVVPLAKLSKKESEQNAAEGTDRKMGRMILQRPNSEFGEAYRAACSALLLSSVDAPLRLLVVTSALPGEGKSTASCNLAIALAQRGVKVLLVDADLRRSSLESALGVKGRQSLGLSSVLLGGSEEEAMLTPFEELPQLTFLPAGAHPPSPAEMLASSKMRQTLERWSQQYDYVILDSAPLIPVTDTLALAAAADGVILVVRSGRSRKKALLRLREKLMRANAHIAGVVVNCVDMGIEHYYSYYSSYRYGKYKNYQHGYYTEEGENDQD